MGFVCPPVVVETLLLCCQWVGLTFMVTWNPQLVDFLWDRSQKVGFNRALVLPKSSLLVFLLWSSFSGVLVWSEDCHWMCWFWGLLGGLSSVGQLSHYLYPFQGHLFRTTTGSVVNCTGIWGSCKKLFCEQLCLTWSHLASKGYHGIPRPASFCFWFTDLHEMLESPQHRPKWAPCVEWNSCWKRIGPGARVVWVGSQESPGWGKQY